MAPCHLPQAVGRPGVCGRPHGSLWGQRGVLFYTALSDFLLPTGYVEDLALP